MQQLHAVIERALCLKAVAAYALAWPDGVDLDPEEAAEANRASDRFWDLVRASGVYGSLTPAEKAFAESRWPDLAEDDLIELSWRIEALKTLLWALQLVDELGPVEQLADPSLAALGAADIRARARLRPEGEVARARQIAELWSWRSQTRELFPDDRAQVKAAARAARSRGELVVVDDDFAVGGKPYRALDEEAWHDVRSVTQERCQALGWLCGDTDWEALAT